VKETEAIGKVVILESDNEQNLRAHS
jgi:hypothetical protein